MKRLILILALVCLATGAFAADVGIGASASYYSSDLKGSFAGETADAAITRIPFDFMVFVDMTYVQLAVGYRMYHGVHEKDTDSSGTTETDYSKTEGNYVSFSGYGKYPMELGSITLFPMIGVEYDTTLRGTYSDGSNWTSQTKSDMAEFWIKGGLGADISVTPQLYIRPELIVGYKLLSQPEKDGVDALKALGFTDVSLLPLSIELSVLFGVRL